MASRLLLLLVPMVLLLKSKDHTKWTPVEPIAEGEAVVLPGEGESHCRGMNLHIGPNVVGLIAEGPRTALGKLGMMPDSENVYEN